MSEIDFGQFFHVELTKQSEFMFQVCDEESATAHILSREEARKLAQWLTLMCAAT